MGVRRNFSTGSNADISLILFQVANDAMQMYLQKTLYPFYTTKKFPKQARVLLAFFEIVFRWSCIRVRERVVQYFVILYSFC